MPNEYASQLSLSVQSWLLLPIQLRAVVPRPTSNFSAFLESLQYLPESTWDDIIAEYDANAKTADFQDGSEDEDDGDGERTCQEIDCAVQKDELDVIERILLKLLKKPNGSVAARYLQQLDPSINSPQIRSSRSPCQKRRRM